MSENIFKSKYLNKAVNFSDIYANKDETLPTSESESDSDSEIDSNNKINFIIDSKPEYNIKFNEKDFEKKSIFGSKLESNLKLNPYLSEDKTPEESLKLLNEMTIKTLNEDLIKKSVIKAGFEQNYCINKFRKSKRLRKKINKELNEKTLGNKWFGMKVEELTEEKKNDLMALSMRRGWDPKRFYKKNESKDLPKFFQIGTIIESKADFYHSRVPKKDRKRTLVEELLADAEFKKYSKKRYSEALAKNPYYLRMKRKKQRQEMKSKGIDFKKRRKDKKYNKKYTDKQSSNQ